MAAYDLTKGQADWNKYLNDYMNGNYIEPTEWSTSGISFLNGFGNGDTTNASSSLKYRTIDFGSVRAIEISGYLKNPEIAKQSQVDYAKLPVNIFKGQTETKGLFGYMSSIWGDQWLKNKLNAQTGTLSVSNFSVSANGVLGEGKFFVDMLTFI